MSTVKLQIIFVKKQKETRVRLTQGQGTTLSNRNSRFFCVFFFTLETDYSCETGYPFDDSRQIRKSTS